MKTYVFTYYLEDYEEHEFRVYANRFTQAFDSFCIHISVVSKNFKVYGFSHSYKVFSDSKCRHVFLTYKKYLALEALKDGFHEN